MSIAFVDVLSFVHNNSTRTFVGGFYNYVLSLFELAYGLVSCYFEVVTNGVRFRGGNVNGLTDSVSKSVKGLFSVVVVEGGGEGGYQVILL